MRRRMYVLCRRLKNGRIVCIADESTFSVNWSRNTALTWDKPPLHYLNHYKKTIKDVFISRINSSACPIELVFKHKAQRASKGNYLFREKTWTVQHECMECGFKGEVTAIAKKIVCPQCKTMNDVWLDGERPPVQHRHAGEAQ